MHKAILLLKEIPKRKVVTYKEMARVCNTSPRAIGRIMAKNPDPINYPCYKVVASNGNLSGYSGSGGLEAKKRLLEKDGVKVVNGKVDKKYFYIFRFELLTYCYTDCQGLCKNLAPRLFYQVFCTNYSQN